MFPQPTTALLGGRKNWRYQNSGNQNPPWYINVRHFKGNRVLSGGSGSSDRFPGLISGRNCHLNNIDEALCLRILLFDPPSIALHATQSDADRRQKRFVHAAFASTGSHLKYISSGVR